MKEISEQLAGKMMSAAVSAGHITIITHMKPDGDALGSSSGLYHFFKDNGCKQLKIILPNPSPSNISFLLDDIPAEDIIVAEDFPQKAAESILLCDLIFCLDFNSFHRAENLEPFLSESKAAKVLIDHHLNPDAETFEIIFSETEVSSTCELLYYVLSKSAAICPNIAGMSLKTATSLYTGMTTDTNNFNNSTYPSTLAMASNLISMGVDRDAVIEKVMHSYKENRIRLIGHLLKDKLTITPEGGACIVIDKETMEKYNIEDGDTEGIVNIPLDIEAVRLSIMLKEDNEKARVSIRSKKGTSANRLATGFFNGGGHENASGGKLIFGIDCQNIEDAEMYAIEHMRSFLAEQK